MCDIDFTKIKYATSIEEECTTNAENEFNYCINGSRVYFEIEEDKTIEINFVEVDEDVGQGKGLGTKLMSFFLEDMAELGFVNFHLFADYDASNFKEVTDEVKGLKRLVRFYQSFGFETFSRPTYKAGCQIDMSLKIKRK